VTEVVPSEAMVEAGARAAYEAQSPIGRKWDDEAEVYRRQWRKHSRAVLVAACTATVTEPCDWCDGEGTEIREGTPGPILRGLGYPPDYTDSEIVTCHECGGSRTKSSAPSWAWLVPFLNAGMLEPIRVWNAGRSSWDAAEIVFEDSGPLPEPDRGIAAFRVLQPATPGEGE